VARIRSTHPGQWTSGDFLECSPLARLLALAVRNVADDHGVFRWKPTTLKAECLPADNCDIVALLEELVRNNQVVRYSVDGKEYGIIKDFTQWQRPKKPKYIHPVPNWFSTSTELEDDHAPIDTAQVEVQSPTSTEEAPQRKEVGGRREKERGRDGSAPDPVKPAEPKKAGLISEEALRLSTEILTLMGLDPQHPISVGSALTVQSWFNGGWPPEAIKVGVQKAMQNRGGDPPGTLKYFEKAIARAHAELTRVLPVVELKPGEITTERPRATNRKPGGSLIASIQEELARSIEEDRRASGEGSAVLCLPPGSVK
jgi:hypothetical protein